MTEFLIQHCIKNPSNVHDPAVRTAYGNLAGLVGIVCNLLLCAAKLLAGLLSGSIAITADAVNNLSDASSSIVTLVGFKLASQPADAEHPYGHARFEYLAGLTVSVLILLIGFELGQTSLDKILHPQPVDFGLAAGAILVLSILVKLWMAAFNRKVGHRIGSDTLIATATDSRNDVISTGAVLAASVLGLATGLPLDGWMGLAVAVFIFISGIGLVKDTVDPLLGQAPSEELTQYIARKVLSYPGVLGTHDLMVHDYGPGQRFASVHVEMDAGADVMKCHDIIDNIERDFHDQDNIHLVIHFDPIVTGDAETDSIHAWVRRTLVRIDPALSMHDFRMVAGPTHTNLIFDVMVPHHFPMTDDQLRAAIQQALDADKEHQNTKYYTVITVDHSYAPFHTDAAPSM